MKKKIGDPKVALKLFLYFFRIGWFTFGGGFSIIAQMQKDFVDKKKLVTEETILDQTSIGRSLPGLMVEVLRVTWTALDFTSAPRMLT